MDISRTAGCALCPLQVPSLPKTWVCVPGCVCWSMDSLRPVMDMSPWAATLRRHVHACTPRLWPHQWDQLMDAVRTARSAGMPLLHIGYFLSKMHCSSRLKCWMSCMSHATRASSTKRSMLVWLLDHRCCPNMCIMRPQVAVTWLKKAHGSKPTVLQRNKSELYAAATLAGAVKCTYSDRHPLHDGVHPQWLRYHARRLRVAWLKVALHVKRECLAREA